MNTYRLKLSKVIGKRTLLVKILPMAYCMQFFLNAMESSEKLVLSGIVWVCEWQRL